MVLLLALVAGIWDVAIATWFPHPLNAITVTLPLTVVLAVFSKRERALIAAIVGGLVLDLFLPSGAGLVSVRYAFIALALHALARNILTNRSFIGVSTLGLLAVLANRLLFILFGWIERLLKLATIHQSPVALLAEVVWMVFIMTGTFVLFVAFSKRFLPLVSRQQGAQKLTNYVS